MGEPEKETSKEVLSPWVNRIHVGDAADVMKSLPDGSIDLVVTSPPYWTAVGYDIATEQSSGSYEDYLEALLKVWRECARVLRPNGKFAINTPIMPIPKKIIPNQHTRHIKNINNDIEAGILRHTEFLRYSFYIWQKQTSKLMFGSYPYPGNLLENNTVEFINVFVKSGKPPKYPKAVKEANKLSREEWIDLTQQIWFMYPEDVKRNGNHPAPFPQKLPGRLIRLYTHGAAEDYPGEIVLDPFCGIGTTCAVAKRMGRRYIGIEICERYVKIARDRVELAVSGSSPPLWVGRPKYPGREDLQQTETATNGKVAEKKHKRQTYGRSLVNKAENGSTGGSPSRDPSPYQR